MLKELCSTLRHYRQITEWAAAKQSAARLGSMLQDREADASWRRRKSEGSGRDALVPLRFALKLLFEPINRVSVNRAVDGNHQIGPYEVLIVQRREASPLTIDDCETSRESCSIKLT